MCSHWSRKKKVLGAFLCEHLFSVSASHEINSLIFGNVQEADGHHVCFTETLLLLFFSPSLKTVVAVELNIFKFGFINETVRDTVPCSTFLIHMPSWLFYLQQLNITFSRYSMICAQRKQENLSWMCLHSPSCILIWKLSYMTFGKGIEYIWRRLFS